MTNEEGSQIILTEKENTDVGGAPHGSARAPKIYILYCFMTLSVMLLTVAFAATELLSVFFSDVYPDRLILSKLFGADADSEMSFQEIILNQSFGNLSVGQSTKDPPNVTPPDDSPMGSQIGSAPSAPQDTTMGDVSQKEPESGSPEDEKEGNSEIPAGMNAIISMNLALSEFGHDYIHNTSSKAPDISALKNFELSTDLSSVYPKNAPLVLIIHTHGTESYSEESWYDPSLEVARSRDKNKNVVMIGRIIADILNANGIGALHSDIMHDEESYGGSYSRSAETVKKYLAEYPTIKYVIDIHRDAVIRSSGELVGAAVETERGTSAQIMAVVGTGEDSTACPNYMGNLALAQEFRRILNAKSKDLCRPTCLRPSAYNQQYSAYSMLIEVGAAGNSIDEAKLAAEYIGEVLTDIIKAK